MRRNGRFRSLGGVATLAAALILLTTLALASPGKVPEVARLSTFAGTSSA